MKYADYIIVGDGYAALFFAHQLLKNGKSFLLFSEGKKSASQVSAGIINPVVLKKFTSFWLAQEQIDTLKQTLAEIADYTGKNYLIEQNIHRILHNEDEKNLWLKKSQNEDLKHFLSTDFKQVEGVQNPFGCGKVEQSARLDVSGFFRDMLQYLDQNQYLIKERFDYEKLNALDNHYGDISFSHIVFAEGIGVKNNPFFSQIPIHPNKGHHIKVKLEQKLPLTLKKKHFLFPFSDDLYYYGGTYDRQSTDETIDETAILQLKNGLEEFYPSSYEIAEECVGFRPTVKDRRPILGQHQEHSNLYVFNGLGARGILNASYFSDLLFQYIEHRKPLPEEVLLSRFEAPTH